jgi:hypothetical protein
MTAMPSVPDADAAELRQTAARVCDKLAPVWPLDRFIAVNALWHNVDRPFAEVAARMERVTGSILAMPLAYYHQAWLRGDIRREHLKRALAERGDTQSEFAAIAGLKRAPAAAPPGLSLLSDVLDERRDLSRAPAWRELITQQLSQFAAAFFDSDQNDWRDASQSDFYRAWRAALVDDGGTGWLMDAPWLHARVEALPDSADALLSQVVEAFDLAPEEVEDYFELVLQRIHGWGAWCAYRSWQARLEGGDDRVIESLLAARLAWELLLDDGVREAGSPHGLWRARWDARERVTAGHEQPLRALWQRAHEIAYQSSVVDALNASAFHRESARRDSPVAVQAAFCIDVRSEIYRRALESVDSGIATLGFAGFFGLPVDYASLGSDVRRPQLPGLLAPALHACDSGPGEIAARRESRLADAAGWKPFERAPLSTFSLVETLGLGYGAKLLSRSLCLGKPETDPRHTGLHASEQHELSPRLDPEQATLACRTDLAEGALRGMGMTHGFARLFLIAGHGSTTRNNPHAAGLDCGACGGQTGEVNARLLARLLNDRAVREALESRGVVIPDRCVFVAGLHDTTTDEVTLFDTTELPGSHVEDLAHLRRWLDRASTRARAERAPRLGLESLAGSPRALERAIRRRSNNWAETRPEWGLARNAAMIIAPRWRSRDVCLDGRAFLHEYVPGRDPDGAILTQIMTAPMVVAHWINMQYYLSTVDNPRYGSGNKVLHNVVGARIGVFEGNTGDLRIGLPLQSLHDGKQWVHEPLRLSVFIDAPRERIEAVLAAHDRVRELVENAWLYLFRLGGETVEVYREGGWESA